MWGLRVRVLSILHPVVLFLFTFRFKGLCVSYVDIWKILFIYFGLKFFIVLKTSRMKFSLSSSCHSRVCWTFSIFLIEFGFQSCHKKRQYFRLEGRKIFMRVSFSLNSFSSCFSRSVDCSFFSMKLTCHLQMITCRLLWLP